MAVDMKTHEEFISGVMHMLAAKPDAKVMLLVDTGSGLEVMQTETSYVWSFGVLAAAEKRIDEQFRASMESNLSQKMEEEANRRLCAALSAAGNERKN